MYRFSCVYRFLAHYRLVSSMSSLAYVQQCFTRYGMTTYIVTGNIGALINILVFSRPAHRRNPGS
jgi:hypothetical protein